MQSSPRFASRRGGRTSTPVGRGMRVARGFAAASTASLLAAVSHALAGGLITALSLIATVIIALPVCTALAGRVGSAWRLGVGVTAAQFLYHWSFAGLGVVSERSSLAAPQPLHAAHLDALASFVPDTAAAGAASAAMWIGHAVAAAATVLLVLHGERAILALYALVWRAESVFRIRVSPRSAPLRCGRECDVPQPARCFSMGAITHRGPPPVIAV